MASPVDVEKIFLKNQEREQALRNLLKTRPSESRDVQALRAEVRAAYSEILGMDPEFCAAKDVELLLWKNCYYKRIEDFRKRLRKYAHLAASLERSKAFEAREHLHGICQAFGRFLGEATEFYLSLLRRFEAMQHQYAKDAGAAGQGGQGGGGGGAARAARLVRLVVLSINRCFIFLGDLARYRELHGENSVKDWSSAERHYHQALAVLPTSGNPHNQLAVLATYTDAECVSVYRYCRSLMIDNPFQTAHENLTLLFEKNKQKGFGLPASERGGGKESLSGGRESTGGGGGAGGGAHHHSKGKGKGSGGRGNTGALLKAFLRRFVRLHGMIFSGKAEDLEDFPSIFETAIADFRTLLSNSAFGDALLLKMVVICIFSVTHVAEDTGTAAAAAAASPNSPTDDEAFSNSGSVADGGSSLDGAGSNSGSTGTQAGGSEAAASNAEEARRNARLSYPLALAFGVSAQIGRHVRTQEPTHPSQGAQQGGVGGPGHGRGHHRHGSHGGGHGGGEVGLLLGPQQQQQQHGMHGTAAYQQHPPPPVVVYGVDSKSRPSSNQPQPRPLGSRLLGPVVLFCDWLTARSQFLCMTEEERSVGGGRGGGGGRRGVASVAVQEAEMRAQFWEVVQRLSATLPDQDPMNQADAFPGDPLGRRRPLKEHVELRGFLPLADLYQKRYAMDGPAVPAVPDDCAGSVRIRGLKAFAAAVSGEPFAPHPADVAQYHDGDARVMTSAAGSSYRENHSEYSEASTGSGSYHMHESARPFELALRPSGPSSQHSNRAPPGMDSGGGMVRSGGEGVVRSHAGAGQIGASGYFGSESILRVGSEGDGWRATQGAGTGARQHTRNASVGAYRVSGQQQQQQQFPSHASHARQHSQPMMPTVVGDVESSGGGQFFHPTLQRIHSQATGVTAAVAPPGGTPGSSTRGAYNSGRHSDAGSTTGSRHSLDSGMRYYDSRQGSVPSAPEGFIPAIPPLHSSVATTAQSSVGANQGSGSGSSGVSSAFGSGHDTQSFGAWSAPGGRSGGAAVGSDGSGGGAWAGVPAEHDPQSFRSGDHGSGDEMDEVATFTPTFLGQSSSRRRSTGTGTGGGPVAVGRGSREGPVGGGLRGDVGVGQGGGGGGGSDLGSAGSPQFGSSRSGSGVLGGGIWSGAFQPQDLALSPRAPSDHNEDGERFASEHILLGSGSWRGALGGSGGVGGRQGRLAGQGGLVDVSSSSVGRPRRVPSPESSSPGGVARGGYVPRNNGNGDGSGLEGSLQKQRSSRQSSFDQRSSTDGGLGYLNNPFQASRQQQQQQQQQNYAQQQRKQQSPPSYGVVLSSHRRQTSGGSVHSARSSPPSALHHHQAFEPPGFSGVIPGSPRTAAPRTGGGGGGSQWGSGDGGGLQRGSASPGQAGSGHARRLSLPTMPSSSGGAAPRSQNSIAAMPATPQLQQQQQQQQRQVTQSIHLSPPLQPMRQLHEQHVYGSGNSRRSSSPGVTSVPGHTFSSAGGGGGGASSSLANNHDDASSIYGSNVSGHSSYSGFSAISSVHAFGGSELSSGGGLAGGGNNVGSWRTPPRASQKGDPLAGDESGNPPAHGSTGGALGWGNIMGSGGTAGAGGGGAREGPD